MRFFRRTAGFIFKVLLKIMNTLAFFAAKVLIPFKSASNDIKVLHISNFAHKPYILTRKLREHGIKADYLALNIDWTYLNMGEKAYDYSLLSAEKGIIKYFLKQFYLLWFVMVKYDIIHVHCQSYFNFSMQEYIYLKKLGKKFIFHFRGCDIRVKSTNNKLHPDLNCCQQCDYPEGSCDQEQQRFYSKTVTELGDAFYATTPDLLDFCPPETEWLPFAIPPLDLIDSTQPAKRNSDIFRVITSSNHDGVDGTEYVRNAVKKLQDEGKNIELVEVHKTPYKEALAIYASADVYAGKLRMGFYNNANIECMLLQVPCMSYIRPKLKEKYAALCPIIQATPTNIYNQLKEYIGRKEDLKLLGKESREYILKVHDEKNTILPLVEKYRDLTKQ